MENDMVEKWHILPINDIFDHEESVLCECRPQIQIIDDQLIITHNAFDGRD